MPEIREEEEEEGRECGYKKATCGILGMELFKILTVVVDTLTHGKIVEN